MIRKLLGNTLYLFSAVLLIFVLFFSSFIIKPHSRVLIFSKTAGFHHSSIPDGIAAIQKLGKENGFETDTTTNADWFNQQTLKKYNALIFLSTTGDLFNEDEKAALIHYIQSGGGYVGIHAASDAEYKWPWYGNLVGAWFLSHPKIQEATLHVTDANNDATRHLPESWKRTDEWYNFKNISPDLHILLTIDEKSYEGGKNGDFHPMAWFHSYDGGRAFYTELGHTSESYTDPLYLKHILGGINYALKK
jgi:type 1 glutamine amidotransferase